MVSTKDVLDHHLKSFSEGDLEDILSDYAPGAVMFTPDGPKRQSIDGDYAYILWTAETADNVHEVATDTFVVRDGKIAAQSFTGKIRPKG